MTKYIIVRKFNNGLEVELNWYTSLEVAREELKKLGNTYKHYIKVELDEVE